MSWPVVITKNRVEPPDHERRRYSTRLMFRITPPQKLITFARICENAVILSMLSTGRVKGR